MQAEALTAEISLPDGTRFAGEISNITGASLFIKTDRSLEFNQRVSVHLGELSFPATVAHVASRAEAVMGAVLVFTVSEDKRRRIADYASAQNWDEQTATESGEAPVHIPDDDDTATSILESDTETRRGHPTFSDARPGDTTPLGVPTLSESAPPLLEGGVNVRFVSREQYRAQHAATILHGGIIVRADPLPLGTQRFLALLIPGHEKYTVSARVTFAANGTVGFAIDSFHAHKEPLRAIAER